MDGCGREGWACVPDREDKRKEMGERSWNLGTVTSKTKKRQSWCNRKERSRESQGSRRRLKGTVPGYGQVINQAGSNVTVERTSEAKVKAKAEAVGGPGFRGKERMEDAERTGREGQGGRDGTALGAGAPKKAWARDDVGRKKGRYAGTREVQRLPRL